MRYIPDSQAAFETVALVESMYLRVLPPALQHDVEAVLSPCGFKCGLYNRTPVASALIRIMSHHVLYETVLATCPK